MICFKHLNIVTACISFTLFVVLLFVPALIFWLFDIAGHESAYFIARRAAMLFLGIAVITCFSRHAKNSEERQAIILGIACSMFGLAGLGLFEYVRGFVGLGIFLAISAEFFLTLLYGQLWLDSRKQLEEAN